MCAGADTPSRLMRGSGGVGLESGRGGSGPGGERGPSCRLLEDPPPLSASSSWALSLGAECMFFFECMFLLASSFKASANCSLPKVSSSIQDFIHLPKLFCHWRFSCSFCQRGSWALITKMWAECREVTRVAWPLQRVQTGTVGRV